MNVEKTPLRPSLTEDLEPRIVAIIFALCFGFSVWGTFVGWKHVDLDGNEFRETQTGLSALFILREDNFSLAYPTPVLGKPWSVPMEFPLYQWTVVAMCKATGLPLTQSGRLISIICFYLGLPALYLLVRRVGASRKHSLIILSLILTCPLYLFYARAFLIETMALMFGLWYMVALIRMMELRRWDWLLLTNLAGIGTGLVKVTTFMLFLLPAFVCSLAWIWNSRRTASTPSAGWASAARTLGWLAAAHTLPFACTYAWIRFADSVKILNPSGAALTSASLTDFNFGGDKRFDPDVWAYHWRIISQEVATPFLLVAGLALVLTISRTHWKIIALCLGLYLIIQTTFPLLYALHAYYHVAAAFLLMVALGFALVGVFESPRASRTLAFGLWLAFIVSQGWTYFDVHYVTQRAAGHHPGLAVALNHITEPDHVLLVAGSDWNSSLPYYAERRALMLRDDVLRNKDITRQAFDGMNDEFVAALVLVDGARNNAELVRLAAEHFDIETEPAFTWKDRDLEALVYLNRQLRPTAIATLNGNYFHKVEVIASAIPSRGFMAGIEVDYAKLLPRNRSFFQIMQPHPDRFYLSFGLVVWNADRAGEERFSVHPETRFWFRLPAGRHELHTGIEMVPTAYEGVPHIDASDGIELVATAVHPDGRLEVLQRRWLNPRDNPADRGRQPIDWTFELPAGAEFELSVNPGPSGNSARDWTLLSPLVIK